MSNLGAVMDRWDIISTVGLAAIIGGVSAFSIPLAVIVFGVAALLIGLLGASKWVSYRR